MVTRPTVISTFAGCGGSSLGYRMAGYKEVLAVEWDDNAVATFKANFPEVRIYHGDIAALSVSDCLNLAGIKRGQLDVFDGSPPCQGFSTAGKRKMRDPRNGLFKEYCRLLEGVQPRVFVFENVTGLVKGHMKQAYLKIIEALRACGYKAKGAVLNAMYFNVAQARERVIIIGVRNDIAAEPSHPKPAAIPLTAGDCLVGCLNSEADLAEATIRASWQSYRVLSRTESKKHFGLVKLDYKKSCSTIPKDCGRTGTGLLHPYEIRKLTIPEIKRLSSFPDDFIMIGSYAEKWARIGNSVPPNFMRAIAEHIKENILIQEVCNG